MGKALSFPPRDCKATRILLFPPPTPLPLPAPLKSARRAEQCTEQIRGAEVCYFLLTRSASSPTVLALRKTQGFVILRCDFAQVSD